MYQMPMPLSGEELGLVPVNSGWELVELHLGHYCVGLLNLASGRILAAPRDAQLLSQQPDPRKPSGKSPPEERFSLPGPLPPVRLVERESVQSVESVVKLFGTTDCADFADKATKSPSHPPRSPICVFLRHLRTNSFPPPVRPRGTRICGICGEAFRVHR